MPTAVANGKKFKFPKGTTPEQMGAAIDEYFANNPPAQAAPAPAPEQAPAADRGTTLSSLIGQGSELANQYAPLTMLARGAEAIAPETLAGLGKSVGDFQSGVVGGAGGLLEGGRQLFNKMTGDTEELAQLNQDTELRRRKLAELTQQNPGLAATGEFIGELAPTVATGGMAGAALAPARMGTLARLLGSAGAGGLQGAAAPLTQAEEAAGERESRAAIGAGLGAVGSAIGPAASLIKNRVGEYGRKVLPDKAAQDFLRKTTGLTDDTAKTYRDILGKTRSETDRVSALSDANYDDALVHEWTNQGNIGFPLHGVDRLFIPANKQLDEVTAGTREIMNSSDAVSELFNAANVRGTKTVDVPVALQAIKDLNKFANDPQMPKTAQLTAEALAKDLRGQSDLLSGMLPEMKAITDKHAAAQDFFNQAVRPMKEAGAGMPIGSWMDAAEGGGTQKAFEDIFFSDKSGMQLNDLLTRVPGAKEDVLKLLGTTRLGQPELHRFLAPSTMRDTAITDPAARKYATMLSTALRGGADDTGAGAVSGLAKRLTGRFSPMVNLVLPEKAKSGVFKFGAPGKKRLTQAEKMAAALRATAILNAMQPEEPMGDQ